MFLARVQWMWLKSNELHCSRPTINSEGEQNTGCSCVCTYNCPVASYLLPLAIEQFVQICVSMSVLLTAYLKKLMSSIFSRRNSAETAMASVRFTALAWLFYIVLLLK